MHKRAPEPQRREQVIQATIMTIHEVGFDKVTLGRVARRAGISPGLVPHYFQDKRGLLAATMRHIAEELRGEVGAALSGVHGPRERLHAILDANFSPQTFAPATVSAWLAFWGQAHGDPSLTRMQRVLRRRLKSNLAVPLRQLTTDAEARRIAQGLSVFVDGLSLHHALGEKSLDRLTARAHATDYLEAQLAHAPPRTAEARHADTA